MNLLELKMVDMLKDLSDNQGAVGVKMEFEAEGTRLEEALRLKEITTKAGLELTVKIGGCEALKDMYDARLIGSTAIVGPMIESAYALKKFLACANRGFPGDERKTVKFLINIETITAFHKLDEMLALPEIQELDGIVVGRVDLVGSMGLGSKEVDSETIGQMCTEILSKVKPFTHLNCTIGGGITIKSMSFFDKFTTPHLDKFETRKIIFDARTLTSPDRESSLIKAVEFELSWLKNKRNFYGMIFREDDLRITMLQDRLDHMLQTASKI